MCSSRNNNNSNNNELSSSASSNEEGLSNYSNWTLAYYVSTGIAYNFSEALSFKSISEALCRPVVETWSAEGLKYFFTDVGGTPDDVDIILEWDESHFYRHKNSKRAILELCSVGMSNYERDQLLGSYGRDCLYEDLREQEEFPNGEILGVRGNMMKQRWYKITEEGQLDQVDGLYQIIQLDPGAFLSLLR